MFTRNTRSRTRGNTLGSNPDDPFDLHERFVSAHRRSAEEAIDEIRAGRKRGCWSWYMFPTAPFVVNGSERGSGMNRGYALRDAPESHSGDAAAAAFLQWQTDGELMLRDNYLEMMGLVAEHLEAGMDLVDLVGFLDDPKLRSSLALFERVSRGKDDAVNGVCARALKALADNEETPGSVSTDTEDTTPDTEDTAAAGEDEQ
eukprot:TRINITY_DN12393_c0_g1_i1.p1 TRINITY_DN12393_c0_g1~~TRINITY_DN12393_c0_g1_i1.p1  ORF type:complete len:202 (-),score=36.78 TRINITY_DN12393_c0_g1_i1:289-894(-)